MPNQNQWSVFKRLLTYLKPYKFLTFLALAFLLSTTVIKSIIPLVASYFIDHYLHDMNQAASLILIGYYGFYLLQTLVQYLGNLFFARVSYSIVRDIRRDAKIQLYGGRTGRGPGKSDARIPYPSLQEGRHHLDSGRRSRFEENQKLNKRTFVSKLHTK